MGDDPAFAGEEVPPEVVAKMSEENERLKREVVVMKEKHEKEKSMLEMQVKSHRSAAELEAQSVREKVQDLEKMKMQMVQLTRKLDDEVSAKDQVLGETHRLERKLQELSMGHTATASSTSKDQSQERERTSQVSMKLMRVVDQWMHHKDLQQALLRNAAINDVAFGTLAQALVDCPSLQTLDLSQNLLTMDSCSDLCQLITTAPNLSFISLAENLFSLRCIGYFMTAIMERQTTKRLVPLDLLDLQGNEGLQVALAAAPPQEGAWKPSKTSPEPEVKVSDPFADLKTAFEPVKEKATTFNLKQIVTRTGTVLMNMLERLLETTDINATDVETNMTLLEFACNSGNLGLAKLCYRRGARLMGKTAKGETAFNICTRNKRYDMMEFLHIYGVKINSADSDGRTALHVAAQNNDVDAICRLLEWGADVNICDHRQRTPIHLSAAGGHTPATMLLLEVGADMNAKDDREYTAMAHAEANNHFSLMDRLVQLGARGHGLQSRGAQRNLLGG
ncbi:unnamed protein product, partial [Effrenium voratum]